MSTLLERVRPDLQPRRDNVPARVARRDEPHDDRPEWLRRGDRGENKAKELSAWRS